MGLKAGIIGLPNVGKSTLFNAITSSSVEAANYPFATINPNSGVVEIKDERVDKLVDIFKPKKTVRATFEFVDIAGLVKGASKGEGLGNQFLANIREVDALCHVVRCFESSEIIHVEGSVNSIRDVEIINLELIFADLEVIEKRLSRIEKKAMTSKEKEAVYEVDLLNKIAKALNDEKAARTVNLTNEERKYASSFNLLTMKPVIYVANIDEKELKNPSNNENYRRLQKFAESEGSQIIPICAQLEADFSLLDEVEKNEFLKEAGVSKSGLNLLSEAAYSLLGLKTYFTVGSDEVRAWTFKEGMKAPECAGIIHTDFEKGFIKAEVYSYEDIIKYNNEVKVKENGRLRIEGKEYLAKDGDIMHFRFNV